MFEYAGIMRKDGFASRKGKVITFYRAHKRMPNVTELMEICGLSSRSSAFAVAERLVEEGVAEKDRTGKLLPTAAMFSLPLLGHVRAGFAAPAEEELADTIGIGDYLLGNVNASYLLQVEGDSMQDAGILSGDMVIFERTQDYKPGDIVVALTEDGYTLKYLRTRGKVFYLEAANDRYPDIFPLEGQIIGKVTAMFRRYGR
ncbi:MAG: repressor LexA [Parcubacteria bacterium C7867-004]|nr:MAG: repressor LexA [Parcubacteria bacterium C7867-004]